MAARSIRAHPRKLSSGRTVQVREHQRQWLPVQYRVGLPVALVGGAALFGAPLLAVAGLAGVYGVLRHPRLIAGAARWAFPRARRRARQLAQRWRDAHSEVTELDRRLSLLPPRPPLPPATKEQRKRWALVGGSQGSYAAYSPRAWEVQASPALTQLAEAQRQGKAEPEDVAQAAYQLAQAQWERASAHSTAWRGKDGQAAHPVLERGGTEVLTRLHYQATAERNGLCAPGEQLAVDRETLWQRQAETEAVCALAAACTGTLTLSDLRNGQVDPESLTPEAREFMRNLHINPPKGDKMNHLASTLAKHYPVTKERAARVVRESLQLAHGEGAHWRVRRYGAKDSDRYLPPQSQGPALAELLGSVTRAEPSDEPDSDRDGKWTRWAKRYSTN